MSVRVTNGMTLILSIITIASIILFLCRQMVIATYIQQYASKKYIRLEYKKNVMRFS